MIALIGIKKEVPIEIREKLTIKASEKNRILRELNDVFEEVVIINTCNRTEIYFTYDKYRESILYKIFDVMKWDINLIEYVFCSRSSRAYKHLFELVSGFHSKIVGEEQILGQVRNAYIDSCNTQTIGGELGRLFQDAIACGKEFRTKARLSEIPVSSSSVVVNKILESKCNSVMVIGYGEIGKLVVKYLLSHKYRNIIVVVREPKNVTDINSEQMKFISFKERSKYYKEVDAIVSCTAAPHLVVLREDLKDVINNLIIFDMAVPRDVEENINNEKIKVFNIDEISIIDDKNKALRLERMKEHTYIIDEYLCQFNSWIAVREIAPVIKEIKLTREEICKKRLSTFTHKENQNEELVEKLIRSTADRYVNRAIEVLKEEKLKGCEEECLRIIKKIFLQEE